MTLSIIGAGLGRTGTTSLRQALIELGHPCYHMFDLAFDNSRRTDVDFWNAVSRGPSAERPDWEALFAGFDAAIDYPTCFFWRELMAAYPQATVVLTHHPRGPEAWYDSTLQTIYAKASSATASGFGRAFNRMIDAHVWSGFFEGRFEDRAFAIAKYEAHSRAVIDGVPAGRLLVYDVTEGWGPICATLGLPVPDRPFPRSNDRTEMARRVARLERMKAFNLRPGNGTEG